MISGYNVAIPKNVHLNEPFLRKYRPQMTSLLEFYINYPDIFIDNITPANSNFTLYFYQRIFLRASLRYRYHYCVAPRAFSKSFLSILAGFLRCMFLPGSKFFICAPGKEQGAKIATEKINELLRLFPMLEKELVKKNMSKDYVTLVFKNGSVFDVVGALDSTRGGRRSGGIIDETRDHDGTVLSEVVLPLMNVDRRMANGKLDETEPHQAQIYITSAGVKGSFAYEKLIELFVQSIVSPKTTFVWGCDYRVPMLYGLLNKTFVEELKISPTYKEDSFAREYLSIWTGGSSDSWIDYDNLSKYRRILNPEKERKTRGNNEVFYYISVDVARLGVLTSVQVFKVTPRETYFYKQLINSVGLHDMHFSLQAIEIKKMYLKYKPKEILIDGTGLGVGLLDFLVMEQLGVDRVLYPALASWNDEEYSKYPGDKVLYVLKATPSLNSKIHSNCFSQIANGHIRFLVKEQEAKSKLMSTKKGAKMRPLDRLARLAPHIETTKLFDEICNLRLRNTGVGNQDIVVEQINRRINKDRFSAFEYALWRIRELEDEYYKKKRNRARDLRKFLLFSKGGKTNGRN